MNIVEAVRAKVNTVRARRFLDKVRAQKPEFGPRIKLFKALPVAVQDRVAELEAQDRQAGMDKYFIPENEMKEREKERLSPSGRYKLVVQSFKTAGNGWNYTRGLVYEVASNKLIAEVRRNYSDFPSAFIEDHPNGHSYMVCGSDYQGQTVIELDTGRRRDNVPGSAYVGVGFCWAEYKFHPGTQILTVCGCIWAAPYEYLFFDFSDPMAGWPCIEYDDFIEDCDHWPEFQEDGTIKAFVHYFKENEEDEDDNEESNFQKEVEAWRLLRRDGLKLIKIDEWSSDQEKKRQAKRSQS